MWFLMILLRKATPRLVDLIFGKAQLSSAGFMGYGHGSNDAQKTMGIITLALVNATQAHLSSTTSRSSFRSFVSRALDPTTMPSRSGSRLPAPW